LTGLPWRNLEKSLFAVDGEEGEEEYWEILKECD